MSFFKNFFALTVLCVSVLSTTTTTAQAQSSQGAEIFSIGRGNNLNQNFNSSVPRSNNPENSSPIHNSDYTEAQVIQINATVWSSSYHLRVIRESAQTSESTICNNQQLTDANNQGYDRCGFAFNQFISTPNQFNNSVIAQLNPIVLGGGGSYWLIIGSGQKNADSNLDPRIKINVVHSNSSQSSSSAISQSSSSVASSQSSSSSSSSSQNSSSSVATSQSSSSSSTVFQSSVSSIANSSSQSSSASVVPISSPQAPQPELPKVSNFSLEENDRSITVRWPAVAGADGYKIFITSTIANLPSSSPIIIKGCPNPINGVNTINFCQFKINGLTNTQLQYIDLLATFGNNNGPLTNQPKPAVPYQIVIDDDAQYSQGCEVESAVCLFTPYEPYRRWSSNRGQAPYKSDLQYNAVGEDSYDVITGTGYPNKGIWQSGQKLNGTYDVLVKYILYPDNATDVNYTIGANSNVPAPISGSNLKVPINQRTAQGLGYNGATSGWIRLGSYNYNNILGVITLDGNSNSGRIVMDAVAFQQIAPTPFPSITTLNLTKTATDLNGGLTLSGDLIKYTISITNNSQNSISNIQIIDTIPAFVSLDPSSIVITSGGIFNTNSAVFSANYITLAPNSSIQITFNAVVKPNLLPKTVITNFVSVITGNSGSSSASADIVIDILGSSSSQSSSSNSYQSSSSTPISQSSSSTSSVSTSSSQDWSSISQSSGQNSSSNQSSSLSSSSNPSNLQSSIGNSSNSSSNQSSNSNSLAISSSSSSNSSQSSISTSPTISNSNSSNINSSSNPSNSQSSIGNSSTISNSSSNQSSNSKSSGISSSSSSQSFINNSSSNSQISNSSPKFSRSSSSMRLAYGGASDSGISSRNPRVSRVTVRTGGKLPNIFGGIATLSLLLITLTMLVRITVGKGL